jgi:predicted HicB family RNase H-like nuclease
MKNIEDKKTSTSRFNLVLPTWLKDAATEIAKDRGISLAEYFKDALKERVERDSRRR